MTLDLHTLFLVTIYVEAILGLLLLFVWAQNLALRAVCWWGFAHLLRLASIALFGMYGQVPDLISVDLANALLFTAFAVTWTGARVFDGRPVEPVYLVQGALFLLRTPMLALLPGSTGDSLLGSVWMTVLSSESLLLTISEAFILLAMAKERTELRHRTAAMVDPLTGIANRRSFLHDAGVLAKRHSANPHPTAVLLIDLDHFKSINDRFGHALGDRVLEIFTDAARASLRASDLIGRLGGEEFAAVLTDTSKEKAVAAAERVRET